MLVDLASKTEVKRSRVCIVGAGPGDPQLLTIRAANIIAQADLILYTGSLVPNGVLAGAKPGATILDSASMTLDAIVETMVRSVERGELVARVHTGDPGLFASVAEQIRRLKAHGIEFEIVPGVSSFLAAAAALGQELTLPELTQTVIISRAAGRTPVPELENLSSLAAHQATLVLFLSAALMGRCIGELINGYGAECPVAVVYRASWPDQRIIVSTLDAIVEQMKRAKITSHAIIMIGRAIGSDDFANSRLYDPSFQHRFRKVSKRQIEAASK
jgi:precorrin-4/cobalt-precorrin-4 C11-methyltransferase